MAAGEQPVLGGTDGFRGEYTEETGEGRVNAETFAGLTAALVMQPEVADCGPVVVARDTRLSGKVLKDAVVNGAMFGSAAEVVDLGIAPTPMTQKVAGHLQARATVAVTASHNPAHHNGWKGMIGHSKPDDEQVRSISQTYYDNLERQPFGLAADLPDTTRQMELANWYHDKVVSTISRRFGSGILSDKLFVYDGAEGAARDLAPRILESLGATVVRFACDGRGPINERCGAADLADSQGSGHPSGLERFLNQHPNIVGDPRFVGALANDGDGDRVMALAARNSDDGLQTEVLNGNHFMWALAQGEQDNGIVGTVYTNGALRRALARRGICFEECGNGDRFVTETLHAKQREGLGWHRGGEFTGHLIDTDWLGSGDGLYMAAWYAADTAKRGMTFVDRAEELRLLPESMHSFAVGSLQKALRYLESSLFQRHKSIWDSEIARHGGRLVIRPSGTEPKVRVWGEANSGDYLAQATTYIVKQIQRAAV